MKVLYVCSDPSITSGSRGGGFRTHMEEMIESFRKQGHEVCVLDTNRGPEAGSGKVVPQRNRRIPRALRVLLRDIFYCLHNASFHSRVSSLLKETRDFDFIYERYCIYQFATVLAARRHRVPLILEFNASIDEIRLTNGLGMRPVALLIEKMVSSRAAAVVTVSGVLKEYLARLGLPSEKVHVMHNGVNLAKFSDRMPGDPVRREFGFASDDVVVGFVGGFSVWHGTHFLLEAAPLAVRENRNIRFLMVGGREGNPRFEGFKRGVAEKGLGDVVRFAGEVPREQVPGHIAAMDVAVIPWATDYGSPTKTFEYMAMGKALVAPRVAALEEVLEHEKSALLVEPGDARGIAAALVRLASSGVLREELGRRARKLVEEKYTWDRNASATILIAKPLLRSRKAGSPRG